MHCPYCGSRHISRQQIPVKPLIKTLVPGFILVLSGWPLKIRPAVFAGIGLILLGAIIGLVTILPGLMGLHKKYWECEACDRVFEVSKTQ